MRLYAIVVGFHDCGIGVFVDPPDSIATLFDRLEKRLIEEELPHQFTAAYSVWATRGSGLSMRNPDSFALTRGDPAAIAKYITPAARLDPRKKVVDYFGTAIESDPISILITWPRALLAQ